MACNPSDLSALCYANGFTLWHYKTPDHPFDVREAGYFNGAASMLRVGDFMFANTNCDRVHEVGGCRAVESCVLIVVSNAAGVVEVEPMEVGRLMGSVASPL